MAETLLNQWFQEVMTVPEKFTAALKEATPLLALLCTATNLNMIGLDCAKKLGPIFDMMVSLMEELIEDAIITDITQQTRKVAADKISTFILQSNKCINATPLLTNNLSTNLPFSYQVFQP